MVKYRVDICSGVMKGLAKNMTIGMRYSFVRRQFSDPEGDGIERQIIDY